MHVVCAKILDIPLVTTDNTLLNSQGLKDYVEIIHPSKCYYMAFGQKLFVNALN